MKTFLLIIEALIYIATQSGDKAVNAKAMCSALGYAPRHMEHILQLLVKHNILRSVRGPAGGYILKQERRKILLNELYLLASKSETKEDKTSFSLTPEKSVINSLSKGLQDIIISHLSDVTLEDICMRALSCKQHNTKNKTSNFTI